MDPFYDHKLQTLKEWFSSRSRVAVAFSGGVDSTLLLKVTHEYAKGSVKAFTACLGSQHQCDRSFAQSFCDDLGIEQVVFDLDELSIPGFRLNPPERCYLCKRQIYNRIRELAARDGIDCILDGTNMDDLKVDRPGRKALKEEGILTPFVDCGLNKADVRKLSRTLGVPTWNKPSESCLYTRIAFGEEITQAKLNQIRLAEETLRWLGLKRVRARLKRGTLSYEIEI